jgi:hypothetical protein
MQKRKPTTNEHQHGESREGERIVMIAASWSSAGAGKDIVAGSDVKGGVFVNLGCGDGQLAAGPHAGDSYLVRDTKMNSDDRSKRTANGMARFTATTS